MTEKKHRIILTDFEQRLLINALVYFRNELLETQRPTEDINNLLLKIIDVPKTRSWRKQWKNTYTISKLDCTMN